MIFYAIKWLLKNPSINNYKGFYIVKNSKLYISKLFNSHVNYFAQKIQFTSNMCF